MATLREQSKQNWNGSGTTEHINTGSLQRIADAAELMAKNHAQLVADRDWYKNAFEESQAQYARDKRRIAALRGVITKLKASK